MKYRMDNNTLKLIRYTITYVSDNHETVLTAANEKEKEFFLGSIDTENIPYWVVAVEQLPKDEWIDNMSFTQEQMQNGEMEKAIAMGEQAYNYYTKITNLQSTIVEMDLVQIAQGQMITDMDIRMLELELEKQHEQV